MPASLLTVETDSVIVVLAGSTKPAEVVATPTAQPTALAPSISFTKGMSVEAQFSNNEWYAATVTICNSDGTYGVEFEDGFQDVLPGSKLKSISKKKPSTGFKTDIEDDRLTPAGWDIYSHNLSLIARMIQVLLIKIRLSVPYAYAYSLTLYDTHACIS